LENIDYQSPMYRHIVPNIDLYCHRCQHPKLSTPSTSTIQDINTINIDVSKIITINIDKNHLIPNLYRFTAIATRRGVRPIGTNTQARLHPLNK
jgi:hypothetical protein